MKNKFEHSCTVVTCLRKKAIGLKSLLIAAVSLSVIHPAHANFYTVTGTADNNDSATHGGSGTSGSPFQMSSVRGAIIAANANPGADTITLPAGTYTLTRVGNDANCQNGDLDINGSLTLTGAGAATTIIQGASNAAFTGSIGDKVIGINQDGTFTNLTVLISGVTIRYGHNTVPDGDPTFAYTGGGVDVFLTGTGNSITFSNCVITGNENVNSYGGGVNIDSGTSGLPGDPAANTVNRGTVNFIQCTIANNKSKEWGGGANLFSDIHNVNFNNCVISNNVTTGLNGVGGGGGGVNIRHTYGGAVMFSNNTVIAYNTGVGYGGGVCVAAPHKGPVTMLDCTIFGNTLTINGPASTVGGGIYSQGLAVALTNVVSPTIIPIPSARPLPPRTPKAAACSLTPVR
jgi:trimeric autotransporter adhesin